MECGALGATAATPVDWRRLDQLVHPSVGISSTAPIRSILPTDRPGEQAHKLAHLLQMRRPEQLYTRMASQWLDPSEVLRFECDISEELSVTAATSATLSEQLSYLDLCTYLPGDILTKVDRAAMACSLETRIPFLDCDIVEWAQACDPKLKIPQAGGKWILRQIPAKTMYQKL